LGDCNQFVLWGCSKSFSGQNSIQNAIRHPLVELFWVKERGHPLKRILFYVVCIFLITTIFAEAGKSDKNARLIEAAGKGNLANVRTALTDGAQINSKDTYGITALMQASQEGHTEVVRLLLDNGADVNAKDTDGTTAIHRASHAGQAEVVKLLLGKGAEVEVKDTNFGATALYVASQQGHMEVVRLLLDKGADVNAKNADGATAVLVASQRGHTQVVKLLLDKDADAKVTSPDGSTALYIASLNGHTEVVKLLLDKGADVNAKATKNGVDWTALKIAKMKGRTDIVGILERAGAKENDHEKNDTIKADSIVINTLQGRHIIGQMKFTAGNFAAEPAGPITVIIFREIQDKQKELAQEIGVKAGGAYFDRGQQKYEYIRDVDLRLSDEDLAKQFGLVVAAIPAAKYIPSPTAGRDALMEQVSKDVKNRSRRK
jgi:ankyrin repeat protein